jgi:hypothetical protein
MNRPCPICHGNVIGETYLIPKEIPLPIPLAPTIQIQQYLPNNIKKRTYYTTFVCDSCGHLEIFVT